MQITFDTNIDDLSLTGFSFTMQKAYIPILYFTRKI
jgi:hypothetical protein